MPKIVKSLYPVSIELRLANGESLRLPAREEVIVEDGFVDTDHLVQMGRAGYVSIRTAPELPQRPVQEPDALPSVDEKGVPYKDEAPPTTSHRKPSVTQTKRGE